MTDFTKSLAVKVGGGGVLVCCWVFEVDCPPCGEGSCEVEAMSPTATQVEQDLQQYFSIKTAICFKIYFSIITVIKGVHALRLFG